MSVAYFEGQTVIGIFLAVAGCYMGYVERTALRVNLCEPQTLQQDFVVIGCGSGRSFKKIRA